jgi:hypothetical protein
MALTKLVVFSQINPAFAILLKGRSFFSSSSSLIILQFFYTLTYITVQNSSEY